MKELKNLKELVETIHNLYSSYEDIGLLIEMGYEDEDPEMVKELEEEIIHLKKCLKAEDPDTVVRRNMIPVMRS